MDIFVNPSENAFFATVIAIAFETFLISFKEIEKEVTSQTRGINSKFIFIIS